MSKQSNRIRMQDILEDTIEYYSESPRAMDSNGSCQYTDADGNHCAIGRYMREEFQTTEFYANNGTSVSSLSADLDSYLKSNVLGLTVNFWSAFNLTNFLPSLLIFGCHFNPSLLNLQKLQGIYYS